MHPTFSELWREVAGDAVHAATNFPNEYRPLSACVAPFEAGGRATAAGLVLQSAECDLVECEANFGEEGGGVKGAKINGKEISASAMRRLTLTNQFNEQVVLPQTENKKDVVVYLRHLG